MKKLHMIYINLRIKEKNIITDNKIWNSIYINGYYFLQVP